MSSSEMVITAMTVFLMIQSIVLLMSAKMLYRTGKYLSELWRQMLTELCDLHGLINSSNSSGLSVKGIKGTSTTGDKVDEKADGKEGSK